MHQGKHGLPDAIGLADGIGYQTDSKALSRELGGREGHPAH